jgi:hypothetical protein
MPYPCLDHLYVQTAGDEKAGVVVAQVVEPEPAR